MLKGKRVILRAVERDDLKRLHELYGNVDLALLGFGAWQPRSMAQFEKFFERQLADDANPLFAISSILDAWAVRGADANVAAYQAVLRKEVDRLRDLMEELLEYGRPYSSDLRRRVLAACEEGERPSAVARRFQVARASVYLWLQHWRAEGRCQAKRCHWLPAANWRSTTSYQPPRCWSLPSAGMVRPRWSASSR